jgi:predicted metal-dependent phosphoesterase TrpH
VSAVRPPASPDGPFVDLQVHSTASDGALPPAEVVASAHHAGLVAFALTDHDTLAGLAEARAAAAPLGLRIVAGVELSADHDGREVHVLGLHIRDEAGLEARLATFREARVRRAEQIVARLVALGIPVTMDDVRAQWHGGALGRPHIARALVARGVVPDWRAAFHTYLGNGRPGHVPKPVLAVRDAIALIHDAGGLAIWAHPAREGTAANVRGLAALGLDGIEVKHPSHSPDDVTRLEGLADAHGLLRSGGSDWHGLFEGPRVIGNQQVPLAWLEAQDRRAAVRQGATGVAS